MYLVHRVFIYQSINHYREIDTNLKVTTAYLFYFYFRKVVIRQRNRNKQNICIINFLVCAPASFHFINKFQYIYKMYFLKTCLGSSNTNACSKYLHPYKINMIYHEYLEILYIKYCTYSLHKICNEEIIILRLPTLFIIVTIPFTFRVNCFTTLGFFCYVTQHIISQGAVAVVFIFIHGRIQLQKGATFHT